MRLAKSRRRLVPRTLLLPQRESKTLLLSSGERFTDRKIVRGVKVRGMARPGLYEEAPALGEDLRQLRAALDAFQHNSAFESEGPPAPRAAHCADAGNRKFGDGELASVERGLFAERDVPVTTKQRRLTLAPLASVFGHASLLSVLALSVSHHVLPSELTPISIEFSGPVENHTSAFALTSVNPQGKLSLDLSQKNVEIAQTAPSANDPISADQGAHSVPETSSSASAGSQEITENYLWNANATSADTRGGLIDFNEQETKAAPELKVVRKTDWQGNPVEDNTLTYSAPGSGVRVTVREASSAGFVGAGFAPGLGPADADTSGPFGPTAWNDNATAKSQKVDGTLVNLKDFGLTAFGYRSEVGYDFRSFGQNKSEFATPGTSTTKFGGEARFGAFAFGLAHSDITKLDNLGPAFSSGEDNAIATVDEASLKFDLPRLLSGESGLTAKLIPTVWMSASDRQPTDAKQASTNSISFGGSWNWQYGNASLGYWNYSSNGDASIGTRWSGQGFDANLGAYYAAFRVDASLSYGNSEGVSPGWQSAGALYSSTMTLSYTPNKLPGVWASASAGNYDQDALAYGGTSTDIYGVSTKGEYWSMAAGLDVTNWFWSPELASGDASRSVKLLYRYTDALTVDSAAGKTSDSSSLVAVMLQRKF
jgi:hypothetical protein